MVSIGNSNVARERLSIGFTSSLTPPSKIYFDYQFGGQRIGQQEKVIRTWMHVCLTVKSGFWNNSGIYYAGQSMIHLIQ